MPVCPKCNANYTGTLKYCSIDGTTLIACSDDVYLPLGEVINDSLSVVSRLRTDRLGVVYQVADKIVTGRASSFRLFHPGVANTAVFQELEQFGNRLRLELECPDIIANFITIEMEDGRMGLLSDYAPGDTLDDILTHESPLSAKQTVAILLPLAEILNIAHTAGFAHGCLTPENIITPGRTSELISTWPKPSQMKLVDFGVGRLLAIFNPRALSMKTVNTGELMVRNYSTYYAPEINIGDPDNIGVTSDIYTLGALCYHMLSGEPPFVKHSERRAAATYITDDPRPLLMLRPELEVPNSLEKLLLKALSRNQAERHQSMTELIEELQEIYFDLSVLIPSTSQPLSRSMVDREKAPTSQLIAKEREKDQTGKLPEIEPDKMETVISIGVDANKLITPSPVASQATPSTMSTDKPTREKQPTRKLVNPVAEPASDLQAFSAAETVITPSPLVNAAAPDSSKAVTRDLPPEPDPLPETITMSALPSPLPPPPPAQKTSEAESEPKKPFAQKGEWSRPAFDELDLINREKAPTKKILHTDEEEERSLPPKPQPPAVMPPRPVIPSWDDLLVTQKAKEREKRPTNKLIEQQPAKPATSVTLPMAANAANPSPASPSPTNPAPTNPGPANPTVANPTVKNPVAPNPLFAANPTVANQTVISPVQPIEVKPAKEQTPKEQTPKEQIPKTDKLTKPASVSAAPPVDERRENLIADTITGSIKPLTSGLSKEGVAITGELSNPPSGVPIDRTAAPDQIVQPTKPINKSGQMLTRWLMLAAAGLALAVITSIMVALAFFQPAVGSIIITTAPTGAQIWLDGRQIAEAPAKLEDVPAGTHRIKVSKNGFISLERDVTVVKKQTVTMPLLSMQPDRPPIDITGTPEERSKEFYRLAQDAFTRGDYITPEENNVLYFTNALLAIDPNDAQAGDLRLKVKEAILKQAEVAQQKNDMATAQSTLTQLLEKFPDDKDAADALKRIDTILESRRGQISQLLDQGEAAFTGGRLIEPANNSAYYFARQVLAIERNNPAGLKLRSRVKETTLKETESLAGSDVKAAIEKYEQLSRLFPEDRRIANQIKLLKDQTKPPVVATNNNDPKKRRDAGLQKYNSGDFSGAASELEAAVRSGIQDTETLFYYASANLKRGHSAEAVKIFNQVLEQNSEHGPTLVALGQIAETRKDNSAALNYYERAAKTGVSSAFVKERLEALKPEAKPKEVKPQLPDAYSGQVTHEHTLGSCRGTLQVNEMGVKFFASNTEHSFNIPLNGISELKISGDEGSFKVKDKRYSFKFLDKNPQRFQQIYYDFFRTTK